MSGWFLVARAETEVIGFVTGESRGPEAGEWAVTPEGGGYLRVEDFYVDPAYREQGIGSALMKHLMTLAKAAGVHRVAVYSSSQPWSRITRFYKSLGLRVWFVQMYGESPGGPT